MEEWRVLGRGGALDMPLPYRPAVDPPLRYDCLASSAPFTNIQTYLLAYLLT